MQKKDLWLCMAIALLVAAFSWAGQEQPKKESDEVIPQQNKFNSLNSRQISGLDEADFSSFSSDARVKDSESDIPAFIDSTDKSVDIPNVPKHSYANAGNLAGRLQKIQRAQSAVRATTGTGMAGGNAVRAAELGEISSLQISTNGQAVNIPKIQNQVDSIVKMHGQLKGQSQGRINELNQIIELTRAHEDILQKLEELNAEEEEITVVDEEEILEQEMIRNGKKNQGPDESTAA